MKSGQILYPGVRKHFNRLQELLRFSLKMLSDHRDHFFKVRKYLRAPERYGRGTVNAHIIGEIKGNQQPEMIVESIQHRAAAQADQGGVPMAAQKGAGSVTAGWMYNLLR